MLNMRISMMPVVVATLVVAGCSSPESGAPETSASKVSSSASSAPSAEAAAGECASSDVPMLDLESQAPDEPGLAVPQPQGWERDTRMDSQVIRAALLNQGLRANDFTPNVVVTLEELTGKVETPEQAVAAERDGLVQAGNVIENETSGTQCGHPSLTVDYTLEGHPVTAMAVAAEHNQKMWAAIVTIQTTEPDNPTYVEDKKTILGGFAFTLPEAANQKS